MIKSRSNTDRQLRALLVVLCVVLVMVIGFLDFITGTDLAFSIFYLIPVALVSWYINRRAGIMISALSAFTWYLVDRIGGHHYHHPLIPVWNGAVGLGFFLVVTFTLAALRESQRTHEQLIQFIVHDLRAPLANIKTGIETLQEVNQTTLDSQSHDLITIIRSSSERMELLINGLLDLSRLERGAMPLHRQPTELAPLVTHAIQLVVIWASQRNVTIEQEIDIAPATAFIDGELTLRVLVNLLSNAIKFTAKGSTVRIHVYQSAPFMLAIAVTDHGPGIPSEWLHRIFDKFVQVEARNAGVTIGSGLGLNFCRLAIEAQDGQIWAESSQGQGATITFTIPVTPTIATA